jgi:hypothetical protein
MFGETHGDAEGITMARKMKITAMLVSTLLLSAAHADAQSTAPPKKPAEPSGDQHPVTEVRTGSEWAATEEVARAPEGKATLVPRLILPGDFGTWAYTPERFTNFSVRVTGGEISLTSRLSLVLEGADDPFDHRFSGMASGLRWHLLPIGSRLQLSVAGGITRDLNGASGLWSQLALAEDLGRWHLAGALRTTTLASESGRQEALAGSGGVAFDVMPVRLGLEYALERGLDSRSALLPWVEVPTKNEHVQFRAGPVVQLNGANPFPARFSMVGNF